MEVRPAGLSERDGVREALAAAFFDDPVATWTTPSDRHRPGVLRHFFGQYFDMRVGDETVYVDEELDGAAIWAMPRRWKSSPIEDLRIARAFAHPRHWRRAPRVARGLLGLEAEHPHKPPHFYLAALGVRPEMQGRGLGSRLLEPVLRICDSDGFGAYLESSKESNIAFYGRHGFRVTKELRMPRGPLMWAMWRDPR
jgi:ribosomal protein S18 acetylase RimI-like enzyme